MVSNTSAAYVPPAPVQAAGVGGAFPAARLGSLRVDIPENLIDLERTAEEERGRLVGLTDDDERAAQWRRWRDASAAVQAAIAAAASEAGLNRYELEQAVKKAVRRSAEGSAK
jgi:hypothetical protein